MSELQTKKVQNRGLTPIKDQNDQGNFQGSQEKKSSGFLPEEQSIAQANRNIVILEPIKSQIQIQDFQVQFEKQTKFLCLFCGGKSCSKQNYLKNNDQKFPNAIEGLHCNWITQNILAMQRPSTRINKEWRIPSKFKQLNIKAIFNLQEVGQHPYCGDSLNNMSGFSYDPEQFNRQGINFFNFGWEDFNITDINTIMKNMAMIDYTMSLGGKIAVHCHAGTGRTGLAIAAWLIYGQGYTAKDAIAKFQAHRQGGLGKSKQREFLIEFQKFLIDYRQSFKLIPKLPVVTIMERQEHLLYGALKETTQNLPVAFACILKRIQELFQAQQNSEEEILASFTDVNNEQIFPNKKWNKQLEDQGQKLQLYIDEMKWEFSHFPDVRIISQVFLDFFDQSPSQIIRNESAIQLREFPLQIEEFNYFLLSSKMIDIFGQAEFYIMSRIIQFCKAILFPEQPPQQKSHSWLKKEENSVNDLQKSSPIKNLDIENNLDYSYLWKEQYAKNEINITQLLTRFSISLLGRRKQLDSHFLNRSLIINIHQDDLVLNLRKFLENWLKMLIYDYDPSLVKGIEQNYQRIYTSLLDNQNLIPQNQEMVRQLQAKKALIKQYLKEQDEKGDGIMLGSFNNQMVMKRSGISGENSIMSDSQYVSKK